MKRSSITTLALLALLGACSGSTSTTDDIFVEDRGDGQAGNDRRHPASETERLWTIRMNGCTGHLIAPELMMTANHCQARAGDRYASGYAISKNLGKDITVASVVEASKNLDYAILKISWANGYPSQQKFPPLVATSPSDVQLSRNEGEGDELYTVGFPADKMSSWGATYSEGRAKEIRGNNLIYNVGIINGNSGGGVWKKRDKMLVSLTNGGPSNIGQPGWDTASAQDSYNWNLGAAMWEVYEASPTLRDVFPGGKNRFGDTSTGPGLTGNLFVAIGAGDPGAVDSHWLHATAPKGATKVVFCTTAAAADCRDGASGYTEANSAGSLGDRAHFRGNVATALSAGMTLSFVALDAAGQRVAAQSFRLAAQ